MRHRRGHLGSAAAGSPRHRPCSRARSSAALPCFVAVPPCSVLTSSRGRHNACRPCLPLPPLSPTPMLSAAGSCSRAPPAASGGPRPQGGEKETWWSRRAPASAAPGAGEGWRAARRQKSSPASLSTRRGWAHRRSGNGACHRRAGRTRVAAPPLQSPLGRRRGRSGSRSRATIWPLPRFCLSPLSRFARASGPPWRLSSSGAPAPRAPAAARCGQERSAAASRAARGLPELVDRGGAVGKKGEAEERGEKKKREEKKNEEGS